MKAEEANICLCGREHLTVREVDILLLTATGKNAQQAARKLGISRRTVEYHIANMLRRTGSATSIELIARCYYARVLIRDTWPPQWSGILCVPAAGRVSLGAQGISPET
jgi:DNA-binding CsgD family transcriptional regulator